ncbi:MAG: hypothetical protein CVV64_18065 [Candidatus Wallbacteria bacterium HGW-Wallbacteria-1]|jgi:anti-sigma28 factor (negative regulator of flagellin synthesis)|uniref:Uncharacterized protein n=1 Tax=Candidatus Wallbacteria bacterium HGW-Wallbacteria-1 TaxID=2013854 RepID=A0A2N1PJS2_9BACT|nr:MAG: hypothetical protein CVV64_18065 [Candidatus Wallbacteria bacterium HGW-Wallbacteria-1]
MSTTRSNNRRNAQKDPRKGPDTTKNVNREKVASESRTIQGSHQIAEMPNGSEVKFVNTGKARRAGITRSLLDMVLGHADKGRTGLLDELAEKIVAGAYAVDPVRIADKLERAFAV